MAFVVPFGQYVPGDSAIHRLDARIKLLVIVAYVFTLFATSGWLGLLLCLLLLLVGYSMAHIPLRLAARGLKPVLIILLFTLIANTFSFNAASPAISPLGAGLGTGIVGSSIANSLPDSIILFGSFGIKPLGLLRGMYFVLRIVLLVSMTSLLTFTSSVVALTAAIASLLRPLRVFKVPVEDIATIFTIALRFIPLTAEEAEKIMVAQTARGAGGIRGPAGQGARLHAPSPRRHQRLPVVRLGPTARLLLLRSARSCGGHPSEHAGGPGHRAQHLAGGRLRHLPHRPRPAF